MSKLTCLLRAPRLDCGFGTKAMRWGRTTLQDLLSDEFARIAIVLMRLEATLRAPSTWQSRGLEYATMVFVGLDDEAW
ncbi:hypothetical protein [Burkholderia territorii]|uniref:hypothetical protein n=1 Tax=Burkholderia territorii TaxID=1503055 RepID=UPI00075B991D|nr:hypothetical protein [Burkholderia territorii]KVL56923.1 hypothetical protein WT00_07350 [Burkholderia territorii]